MVVGEAIGKYRVLSRIGRGGMGTVYKAVDETLAREVAIKSLNAEVADAEILKRFRAEAVTLARLNHPNIAMLFELTEHDGQLLMIMEFVRGETLDRVSQRSGPMPVDQAARICAQVLDALAHAHGAGVVHRDLKPANLMLTESGLVKVMDFGLARMMGTEHLTNDGFMVGTPAYMAPEQVLGKEIDGRADVYAMGVVLYRLLTSQLPFHAESGIAMVQKQINDEPTPVRQIRRDLPDAADDILTRALAKAPDARFQSADEFRNVLLAMAGLTASATLPITSAIADARLVQAAALQEPTLQEPTLPLTPTPFTMPQVALPAVQASPPALQDSASSTARTPSTPAAQTSSPETLASPPPAAASSLAPQASSLTAQVSSSATLASSPTMMLPRIAAQRAAGGARRVPPRTIAMAAAALVILAGVPATIWLARHRPRAGTNVETLPAALPKAPAPVPAVSTAAPIAGPVAVATAPSTTVKAQPPPPVPARTHVAPPATSTHAPAIAADAGSAAPPAESGAPTADRPAAPGTVGVGADVPIVTFQGVKLFVVAGDKGHDQDATLRLGADRLEVLDGSTPLQAVSYADVVAVFHSHSREPEWTGADGKSVPVVKPSGLFQFLKGPSDWITVKTSSSFVSVRVDETELSQVIDGLEARTGTRVIQMR